MASTESTVTEDVLVHHVRTKYHWPALQLNFWLLIMIVGSSTILGVFAYFMTVQSALSQKVPWLVFSLVPCVFCFLPSPSELKWQLKLIDIIEY